MAQFDVHRTLGRSRETRPYLVVVQSSLFDDSAFRLVVPLNRMSEQFPDSAPTFSIEDMQVVADALQKLPIPKDRLGAWVASLADDASARGMSAHLPDTAPTFSIEDVQVVADALQMFPIPKDRLGAWVASLADDASARRIIDAIDQTISTAYG